MKGEAKMDIRKMKRMKEKTNDTEEYGMKEGK